MASVWMTYTCTLDERRYLEPVLGKPDGVWQVYAKGGLDKSDRDKAAEREGSEMGDRVLFISNVGI